MEASKEADAIQLLLLQCPGREVKPRIPGLVESALCGGLFLVTAFQTTSSGEGVGQASGVKCPLTSVSISEPA